MVIGAGIAGISAAYRLQRAGLDVHVVEAANHPGGRCRTFHDDTLGCDIDNGTHLVLSGNANILEMADPDELIISERARFPFYDLKDGHAWTIDLGAKRIPWMHEGPPGADLWTLLHDLRKLKCDRPVADVLDITAERWRTLWVPITLAVMNTRPDAASARLLHAVLAETLLKGGHASRPVLTRRGLGAAFVEPWAAQLDIRYGARVDHLEVTDGQVSAIVLRTGETIALETDDHVVVATSWADAHALVVGETPPAPPFNPIVNVHYHVVDAQFEPAILGLVNARSHWLSLRGAVASVTISAAHDLVAMDNESIGREIWAEVATRIDPTLKGNAPPAHRVIKEKRATFAATPDADRARPAVHTALQNMVLAGDWVQTGFPATLEGAARAGKMAAEAVLAR